MSLARFVRGHRKARLLLGAAIALPLLFAAACTAEEEGQDVDVQKRDTAGRGGSSSKGGTGGTEADPDGRT